METDELVQRFGDLLEIEHLKGHYEGTSVLPSIRRDAGTLHHAIKERNLRAIQGVLTKYRRYLKPEGSSAKEGKPHENARTQIAQAAARAIAEIEKEEADDDFTDLPRDLAKLTAEQRERIVRFYARLSMRELRRRQDLTRTQIAEAARLKAEDALLNLQTTDQLLAEAVDRSTFGDLKHLRDPRRPRPDDHATTSVPGLALAAALVVCVLVAARSAAHRRLTDG